MNNHYTQFFNQQQINTQQEVIMDHNQDNPLAEEENLHHVKAEIPNPKK